MEKYHVDNLPEKYCNIVRRMIAEGLIDVDEDKTIDASIEMLEIFLILGRLGLV